MGKHSNKQESFPTAGHSADTRQKPFPVSEPAAATSPSQFPTTEAGTKPPQRKFLATKADPETPPQQLPASEAGTEMPPKQFPATEAGTKPPQRKLLATKADAETLQRHFLETGAGAKTSPTPVTSSERGTETPPKQFLVAETGVGMRLDQYVASQATLSRSAAQRLIDEGLVFVNQRLQAKRYPLRKGDVVVVYPPPLHPASTPPENIKLRILYEDEALLVVNKPSGMVVHPAAGNWQGTLVNALLHHCAGNLSGVGGEARPGIVHRIDKDTSGLLVVAKTDAAHQGLAAQLATHSIRRVYHALVNGGFKEDSGTVSLPIGRHPIHRKKMAVIQDSRHTARHAVTHYRVIERFGSVSYLALELETGRTHQIRVHMAALGHALLGDTLYGGGGTAFEKKHAALLSGQCLHAKQLSFVHPLTGENMTFESPLPDEFEALLAILRKQNEG